MATPLNCRSGTPEQGTAHLPIDPGKRERSKCRYFLAGQLRPSPRPVWREGLAPRVGAAWSASAAEAREVRLWGMTRV